MPKLKLNTFKNLYKSLKTPWKPINWIILGYLIGIEKRYIELKAAHEVDTAVRKYKQDYFEKTGVLKQPDVRMKKTDTGWEMSIGDIDDN